jgi:hypothetical protein
MQLDIIAYLIIAIVGIAILLILLSGPLSSLTKGVFCFFYQSMLHQQSSYCKPTTSNVKQVTVCSKAGEGCDEVAISAEEVARIAASYTIACWQTERSTMTPVAQCYSIFFETHPGTVTETMMTQIMERENGCQVLENSKVVDESGNLVSYIGNCGTNDNIVWEVSGNVLSSQTLVSIKYDRNVSKIVIRA